MFLYAIIYELKNSRNAINPYSVRVYLVPGSSIQININKNKRALMY